jgi:hypothetical protein
MTAGLPPCTQPFGEEAKAVITKGGSCSSGGEGAPKVEVGEARLGDTTAGIRCLADTEASDTET